MGFIEEIKGVDTPKPRPILAKRPQLSLQDYLDGIDAQDRTMIARAVTLIESKAEKHHQLSRQLLQKILPKSGKSIRIGITGLPGAGKSTFIDAFGTMLCKMGYKLAVLAIDPSSTHSGGSILGDKTRMENLILQENCFIRPTASGGVMGGVNRRTREAMLLLEAAGYDVIFVETVGVGQNEASVRSMVDFFMLLTLTGGGDDLQNIKKGVIENADALVINKADGNNINAAERLKVDLNNALHYLMPATKGWESKAVTCSALNGTGLEALWKIIESFKSKTQSSGVFVERRNDQLIYWVKSMVQERLLAQFFNHPQIKERFEAKKEEVLGGQTLATTAADDLINAYLNTLKK